MKVQQNGLVKPCLKKALGVLKKRKRNRISLRKAFDRTFGAVQSGLAIGRSSGWKTVAQNAHSLARNASRQGKCGIANKFWYLACLSDGLAIYSNAFALLGQEDFYEAWCQLEQAEIACGALAHNPFIPEFSSIVESLAQSIERWQSLYPYKVFFSPEMIIRKSICSICEQETGPWSKCTHRPRQVYCGKMCTRIIKDIDFRAIALVLDPVQKYSVARIMNEDGSDQFNYEVVQWVRDRVVRPFDKWKMKKMIRMRAFSDFPTLVAADPCPCDSGRDHEICCSKKGGISTPHYEFWFETPPPSGMPNFTQF